MSTTARDKANVSPAKATRQQVLFEDLAQCFHAGVCNYLRWISRDPALAEDLTQETFMRVWRSIDDLRHERAAKAWIFRTARNQFLQQRRRSHLETVPLDDCAEADLASAAPTSELQLERAVLRDSVARALSALSEDQREVIVLHNLEDLSLAQVADVLGLPIGTVKSRRARAFASLRRLLCQEVTSDEA